MKPGPIVPYEEQHCTLIDCYLWITVVGAYSWKDGCYDAIHESYSSQRSRSPASRDSHFQGLMSRQQSGSVARAWKPG